MIELKIKYMDNDRRPHERFIVPLNIKFKNDVAYFTFISEGEDEHRREVAQQQAVTETVGFKNLSEETYYAGKAAILRQIFAGEGDGRYDLTTYQQYSYMKALGW